MDAQKAAFVFGEIRGDGDPNDKAVRHRLVEQRVDAEQLALGDGATANLIAVTVRRLIADQIAEDTPTQVWSTARRLLDDGLPATLVMANLVMAAEVALVAPLASGEPVHEADYIDLLNRLPLPPVREVTALFRGLAGQRRSVPADELVATSIAFFGGGDGPVDEDGERDRTEHWVELAVDRIIEEDSTLILPPDLMVHVPTLMEGITLTHRLTDEERQRGWLFTGADLAPVRCWSDPLLWADGSEVEIDTVNALDGILEGPPGWLDDVAPETLMVVRVDGVTLSVRSATAPGPPDPDVVGAARTAYDWVVDEQGLPVEAADIVAWMLLEHPDIFSTPTVPVSELLAQAGLEQRGVEFAHEESVWRAEQRVARMFALFDRLPDPHQRSRAADVLDLLEAEERSPGAMGEALATLGDPRLLPVITDQLLDLDDDEEQLQEVAAFAEALLASARRPADGVAARWLLAVVSERRGDPLAGQAHLELAVEADPQFTPAIDRLAWYLSDRGDATGAARLWRRLGADEHDSADLREMAPFTESVSDDTGRNEPCWCGSGRKFKHCHLGEPRAVALPDRVGWLCRKAVAYLDRRGGDTFEDVYDLALVRADGDDSEAALDRAFSDPLVIDVALHEGGWFERFLAERGALLPDDEALLATAWLLVDRTLYEVVETRPGQGMVVRDLRSAELIEVRERTFSHQAREGQVFCGRAVPDGETHQFIGGIVPVRTGREKDLLDLLDEGDGEELLAWVAAAERPPRLVTSESEDLRRCRVDIEVPDADAARVVLDRLYDSAGGEQWHEHHQLANGESIIRASLSLRGGRITVETMSEPRVERVIEVLTGAIAGAEVVSDERREIDPSKPPPGPVSPTLSPDDSAVREMMRTYIAGMEQAWCDEEIPALGGLTPRQAAAEPAGRESLERLLAEYGSYVDPEADPEMVPQHPDRLRRLLGLDQA